MKLLTISVSLIATSLLLNHTLAQDDKKLVQKQPVKKRKTVTKVVTKKEALQGKTKTVTTANRSISK